MSAFRRSLALRVFCLFSALLLWQSAGLQPARALEKIEGAGFVREEGEYLSDQFWTNDDWVQVGTDLISSGGAATFDLGWDAAKYTIGTFFATAVKPIEFWLSFISHWRDETGQRAPEDFRMMTGMMLDQKVDITWLQAISADISRREGWDHIFPQPWLAQDDHARMPEYEGGMEIIGAGAPRLAGAGPASAAPPPPGQSALGRIEDPFLVANAAPATDLVIPLPAQNALARIEATQVSGKSSKLFERYVNHLAGAGYLEKSLGIPPGAKFIDLGYHGGVNGADGFFISGEKCYLLEMKWYKKGGGKLGVIKVAKAKEIVQAGPEWFCKVLYKIKKDSPERFAEIMRNVKGSRMGSVMEMVEIVHDGAPEMGKMFEELSEKEIGNFTDLEKTMKFVKSKKGTEEGEKLLEKVAGFIEHDIHVGVVSKEGRAIQKMDKMIGAWGRWGSTLTGKTVDIAKRIVSARVK